MILKERKMQKKEGYGACASKERCKEILTEEIQDHLAEDRWPDYERAVNRVLYEFDKIDGAKPKFHKGKHVNDWYTCGHCGCRIDVGHNFCHNCGYKVLWEGTRCLTK